MGLFGWKRRVSNNQMDSLQAHNSSFCNILQTQPISFCAAARWSGSWITRRPRRCPHLRRLMARMLELEYMYCSPFFFPFFFFPCFEINPRKNNVVEWGSSLMPLPPLPCGRPRPASMPSVGRGWCKCDQPWATGAPPPSPLMTGSIRRRYYIPRRTGWWYSSAHRNPGPLRPSWCAARPIGRGCSATTSTSPFPGTPHERGAAKRVR